MTTSAAKSGPLVVVEWADSCSLAGGGWGNPEDLAKLNPHCCVSVGWIASENKDCIVLVPHWSETQVGGDMCIPKSAILKRHTLRDPTKKR